jgi:hypothetical protein
MSRTLKSFHLFSLSLGFLSAAAMIFNTGVFVRLYPLVTQFQELNPSWESYGIAVGLDFILIAIFHLSCVGTLLAHLVIQKTTSKIKIAAITLGVISGVMILGDMALLSDIGKEFPLGWQTIGEWITLFISYGLHYIFLVLAILSLISNLKSSPTHKENIVKDEVLFLSLHSTGLLCGWLGLIFVVIGLVSNLTPWMMKRIVVLLGSLILSPYLVILAIWIFRRRLGDLAPGLDEKQFQDLSRAGLWTLLYTTPVMVGYFGFQISPCAQDAWPLLWLPLLIFLTLTLFSSFVLSFFRN